jgi:hypothetical protein
MLPYSAEERRGASQEQISPESCLLFPMLGVPVLGLHLERRVHRSLRIASRFDGNASRLAFLRRILL